METRGFLTVLLAALALGKVYSNSVEVLVVVDDYTWDEWDTVASAVGNSKSDELYSSFYEASLVMSRDLGFDIRVSDVGVLKFGGDILAEYIVDADSDVIDAYAALEGVQVLTVDYLSSYKFDAVLWLTGHDLGYSDGSSSIDGIAYTSGMCSDYNVALIQLDYTYKTVHTIYHEIGHLLGSSHDGDGNDCDATEGWVMSPGSVAYDEHFYEYSSCSKSAIDYFVSLSVASCLYETDGSISLDGEERLGRLIGGDETCSRYLGYESYVDPFDSNDWDICQVLPCITDIGNINYGGSTPQGLPCGPYQSCNFGQCSDDATVPGDVDPDCMFGDTAEKLSSSYSSCEDVVASYACGGDQGKYCCETCAASGIVGK